jgi:hypothetical protein
MRFSEIDPTAWSHSPSMAKVWKLNLQILAWARGQKAKPSSKLYPPLKPENVSLDAFTFPLSFGQAA